MMWLIRKLKLDRPLPAAPTRCPGGHMGGRPVSAGAPLHVIGFLKHLPYP